MADGAAEPVWPDDAVEVGRIVDAWGIKGWFKVQPYAADPQALLRQQALVPEAARQRSRRASRFAGMCPRCCESCRRRSTATASWRRRRRSSDRNAAEALHGARIFVARRSFPSADTDEYYWVDLIGLAVVNRQGEALGSVVGLLDTGAHSVLRVAPDADAQGKTAQEPSG